jgi:hypothetical protein
MGWAVGIKRGRREWDGDYLIQKNSIMKNVD